MIATLVRSIFEQSDRDATWDQLGEVVDRLTQAGFNDIAVYLLDSRPWRSTDSTGTPARPPGRPSAATPG